MPAPSSPLARAFSSLQAAQARATGKHQRVRIARKWYEAIIEPLTETDAFVSGGVAQSGGFKVSIAQSLFAREPKKFTPIQVEGSTELEILSCNGVNGVTYEITAGDPTAEERA